MGFLTALLKRLGGAMPDKEPMNSVACRQQGSWEVYTFCHRGGRVFSMSVDREDPFGGRWWLLLEGRRRKGRSLPAGVIDAARMPGDAPDTLTLGDIRIEDVDDRHNGLGTLMLHTLFRIARQQGVRYIHGFVTPEDQHATPGLLDWYRREGFAVRGGDSTAQLHIDLHTLRLEAED